MLTQQPKRRTFYQQPQQSHYGEVRQNDSMVAELFTRVQNCELDEFIQTVSEQHTALNVRDRERKTLLHACINQNSLLEVDKQKRLQLARYLISHGVGVAAPDMYGVRPLHLAVKAQDSELVSLFLQEGADPNVADSMGMTPLHYAVTGLIHTCKDNSVGEFIGHDMDKSHVNQEAMELFDLSADVMNKSLPELTTILHKLIDAQTQRYLDSADGKKLVSNTITDIRKSRASADSSTTAQSTLTRETQNHLYSLQQKIEGQLKPICEKLYKSSSEDLSEDAFSKLTGQMKDNWGDYKENIEKLVQLLQTWHTNTDNKLAKCAKAENEITDLTNQVNDLFATWGGIDDVLEFYRDQGKDDAFPEPLEGLNQSRHILQRGGGKNVNDFVAILTGGKYKNNREFLTNISNASKYIKTAIDELKSEPYNPDSFKTFIETYNKFFNEGIFNEIEDAIGFSTDLNNVKNEFEKNKDAIKGLIQTWENNNRMSSSSSSSVAVPAASSSSAVPAKPASAAVLKLEKENAIKINKAAANAYAELCDTIRDAPMFYSGNKLKNALTACQVLSNAYSTTAKSIEDNNDVKIVDKLNKEAEKTQLSFNTEISTAIKDSKEPSDFFIELLKQIKTAEVIGTNANIATQNFSGDIGEFARATIAKIIKSNPAPYKSNYNNPCEQSELCYRVRYITAAAINTFKSITDTFDVLTKNIYNYDSNQKTFKLLSVDKNKPLAIDRLITGWAPENDNPGNQPPVIGEISLNVHDKMNFPEILEYLQKRGFEDKAPGDDDKPSYGLDRHDLNLILDYISARKRYVEQIIYSQNIKESFKITTETLGKYLDDQLENDNEDKDTIKEELEKFNKYMNDIGVKLNEITTDHMSTFNQCSELITILNNLRSCLIKRDSHYWIYHIFRAYVNPKYVTLLSNIPDKDKTLDKMDNIVNFYSVARPYHTASTHSDVKWPVYLQETDEKFQLYRIVHTVPEFISLSKSENQDSDDDKKEKDSKQEVTDSDKQIPITNTAELDKPNRTGWPFRADKYALYRGDILDLNTIIDGDNLPSGNRISENKERTVIEKEQDYLRDHRVLSGGAKDESSYKIPLLVEHGDMINAVITEILSQQIYQQYPNDSNYLPSIRNTATVLTDSDVIHTVLNHASTHTLSEDIQQYITHAVALGIYGIFEHLDSNDLDEIKQMSQDVLGIDHPERTRAFRMERPVRSRMDRMASSILSRISNAKDLRLDSSSYMKGLYQGSAIIGNVPKDPMAGDETIDLFETWAAGSTHRARCRYYNSNVTLLLLRADADPSPHNIDGNTPLHLAIEAGNILAARILVKLGAMPDSKRAINNKQQAPLDTLRRQLMDRVLLCHQSSLSKTLDAFVAPIVREAYRDIRENYMNNIPDGITMAVKIAVMMWNHRMWQRVLETKTEAENAADKSFTTADARSAVSELSRHGIDLYVGSFPPTLSHGLLNFKANSLFGKNDYNKALIAEKDALADAERNIKNKIALLCGSYKTLEDTLSSKKGRDYGDTKVQLAAIKHDVEILKANLSSVRQTYAKLMTLNNEVRVKPTEKLQKLLKDFRNSAPRETGKFHERLLKCYYETYTVYPLYKSYEAMWETYIQTADKRPENIGFILLDYAYKIATIPTTEWKLPAPSQKLYESVRSVAKLGRHCINPIPRGVKAYTQEQPEAHTMVQIITTAVRGTVGGSMYRALLHLLTDHIAQNSSSQSRSLAINRETNPLQPDHIVPNKLNNNKPVADPRTLNIGLKVKTEEIVENIAGMYIDQYNLHEFLLEYSLPLMVKKSLGIIENRYDATSDFNKDYLSDSIKLRLQTNPFYPILPSSNFIDQLESTFFPFWFDAIETSIDSCRTAVEGWSRYMSTIVRQLEMVADITDLSIPKLF